MKYSQLTRQVGSTVRLAHVVQVLVKHGFADLVRRAGLHEGLPAKVLRGLKILDAPSGERHTQGRRFRAVLMELGPTFVKFGQILSTRPDLIGHAMAREMELLQDRVKPLPYDKIAPVFERHFGKPVEQLFIEFNPEPVASASLSQVYRAKTREGEPVAVKVQRPNARHTIEGDLHLMRAIAEWVDEHVTDLQWLDPIGAVDEFNRSIHRELDFNIEARVIDRFRDDFAGDDRVLIPRTFPELSCGVVLTMEWIDGVRIDDFPAYAARRCSPQVVARTGCEILCKQVFEHRFFHADPHPGNVLIHEDNRIAFLDYGMVGHLEQADVIAIADLLRAIIQEDAQACLRTLHVFTDMSEVQEPEGIQHAIADLIAFEAQATLSGARVGDAIEKIMDLLRRYQLRLAPRFSLLMKALATIESAGHQLDPRLDFIPILRPYVEQIVYKRWAPDQIFRDMQQDAFAVLRMLRDMPGDLQSVIRAARKGRFRVQLNHEGLREFAHVTDQASNRLSLAIITGSLIVSSGWLVSSPSNLTQNIGLGGFIVAGILGLGLAVSIIRSRNF